MNLAWLGGPFRRRSSDQPNQPDQPPLLVLAAALPALMGSRRPDRQRALRHSTYTEFLACLDSAVRAPSLGPVPGDQRRALQHALDVLTLIGPEDVVAAAQQAVALVDTDPRPVSDVEHAQDLFLAAARRTLEPRLPVLPEIPSP